MNELEQVWRERIDWVQASGLTIAAASAEPGVSAAAVYRWKKLPAESPVPERHPAGPGEWPAGATKSPEPVWDCEAEALVRSGQHPATGHCGAESGSFIQT
ncbi:MAG: helix-turn-helix domain-containing protein [Planctomycetaceae bacterium]